MPPAPPRAIGGLFVAGAGSWPSGGRKKGSANAIDVGAMGRPMRSRRCGDPWKKAAALCDAVSGVRPVPPRRARGPVGLPAAGSRLPLL